jgi:hypothetical protein
MEKQGGEVQTGSWASPKQVVEVGRAGGVWAGGCEMWDYMHGLCLCHCLGAGCQKVP